MTDYERDMHHWRNLPESTDLNGCNPKPNRKDYDKRGNKIGTQYTSDGRVIDPYLVSVYGMEYATANARKEEISNCPFSAKHCKWCGELYCSDREYETPTVTVRTYNANNTINMEQKEIKELTAQEIVEKLIDDKKISGKEAVILLNAINKPAEIRIEKEYTPYTPYIPNTTPWYQSLAAREPKCYEPGGTCANPHMDCVNCPRTHSNGNINSNITYTYTTATREIPNPVEPAMKEE